jgi:hypothetical protein
MKVRKFTGTVEHCCIQASGITTVLYTTCQVIDRKLREGVVFAYRGILLSQNGAVEQVKT